MSKIFISTENQDPDKPPYLTEESINLSSIDWSQEEDLVLYLYESFGTGKYSIMLMEKPGEPFELVWHAEIFTEDGRVMRKLFQDSEGKPKKYLEKIGIHS